MGPDPVPQDRRPGQTAVPVPATARRLRRRRRRHHDMGAVQGLTAPAGTAVLCPEAAML